ncbi:RNA binding domain protein [Cordyceps javanica]|nr:RNA binding domain protein [Cordyceps javanica]
MNQIRAIQALNKKEIENGISPEASWHTDYRDTAYVYFGGLPYELSEGDIITIFSQFGEPVFLKLVRDKETGKSKGFGWLKYENQKSTDLAVDNLGGAEVGGRLVRVDHARYSMRDDEDQDEFRVGWEDLQRKEGKPLSEDESSEDDTPQRPMLQEERDLAKLIHDHDDDDPMKAFLIEEKRKEVDGARERAEKKESRQKHRSHRSHSSRHNDDIATEPRSTIEAVGTTANRTSLDRGVRTKVKKGGIMTGAAGGATEKETTNAGTGDTQAETMKQIGTISAEDAAALRDAIKIEERNTNIQYSNQIAPVAENCP